MARGERFSLWLCPRRPNAYRWKSGRPGRVVDCFRTERQSIVEALQAIQPDVVHAHWLCEFAWAAIESRYPSVVTAHDVSRAIVRYQPSVYRIVRWMMATRSARKAGTLTAVSPYVAGALGAKGDVAVVPNPLPPFVADLPAASQTDGEPLRVAMVCNGWASWKNPEAALKGFALFRRQHPEAQLWCFGADFGPGEYAADWMARHQCGDSVQLRGSVPHRALLEDLARCHVLLHPSLEEAFPMAIAEAMAIGLAVIGGKDSGGVPFVVGEHGLLVDVRSPEAISAALARCAEDAQLRAAFGAGGRRMTLERCSVERVADAYERQYALALEARR